jgi:hypothetical protein
MLSRVSMVGDNPPCKQNISDSTYKKKYGKKGLQELLNIANKQ